MFIIVCNFCKKDFKSRSATRKYCSFKCYSLFPKKQLSEQERKKLSERVKQQYKDATEEHKRNRWDNIGKARKVHLTKEEVLRLEEILVLGYVGDLRVLCEGAKISKSYKALLNYIEDNPDWWGKWRKPKYIQKEVQQWPPEKMIIFQKEALTHDHRYLSKKYNIKNKALIGLLKNLGIKKNKIELTFRKVTKPEQFVWDYLLELNIDFKREKYINNQKWRVDFLINKKVIEVQGDFWHANPNIFDYEKLTFMQKSNVLRDIEKHSWIKTNGYKLLEVWEGDIKMFPNKVKLIIKEFINE